jgi:hypothetical protein
MPLPSLFQPHEPRSVYPVFASCENRLSYLLRGTYVPNMRRVTRHIAGRMVRRDRVMTTGFAARLCLDALRGIRLRFRGAFLDRSGRLVAEFSEFANVGYLQGFDISVNDLLRQHGVQVQDGQFLLIADRPVKLDTGYGIGTVSASYFDGDQFTCYRNGAFARPTNEFTHHRPIGFRSIAPHMMSSRSVEAAAYFFNFSSDSSFDRTANPTLRLYRSKTEYLEGKFGPIEPFGAAERSIKELFGENVSQFLGAGDGYGTLIAEQEGMTLGSIHLLRNSGGRLLAIEHTRPTQLYVR